MGLDELMAVWDHLPALEAVARAWQEPPGSYGTWHRTARAEVGYLMPLLTRALDRLLLEHADVLPSGDERLWQWPAGADVRGSVRTDRVKPLGRGDVGRHR